ncbi:DUF624 domain-containing protein [Pseudoflavonifractor sp. 524-17]|uniref:DUF624 domain-containing protein n=1 Tax=Pseudoflavonifractor sp. 524-17 TaxID=2304577 RepID=UPI001379F1AB|nr:DUF624 domain-containing protein [Pseudoflavonifractor sp. 524-17]NCE65757.1 DUF624 domain-containing protein [Pseudoflavonifractor sp. 524-17]
MFFRKDYAAPGPGVDPNAPEKTGMARFVEILSLESVTLFQLNLLFLASCVPVVTIPPAIFAMNCVVRSMVLDQPVDLFYHYRTAFRTFWRRGYGAFFITAVPLVLGGYGAWFYLSRALAQPLFFLPFLLCSTIFLLTLLASSYFYGLLTTKRRIWQSLRLAVILGAARPLRAIVSALCVYGTLTAAVLEFPLSAIYLLLIGFSIPCLLGNFFVRTVLKQVS